jgi:hypothetical protein
MLLECHLLHVQDIAGRLCTCEGDAKAGGHCRGALPACPSKQMTQSRKAGAWSASAMLSVYTLPALVAPHEQLPRRLLGPLQEPTTTHHLH